ncbi:hypothetical protein QJ527_07205 [Enterococcus mundtii]|uniref:hypothetical protein n=1 Tax=Enterococcus TaxID=1350 RepID=UPI000448A1E7|nr:hypothetical protein [Enterococcus mundtii]EYT95542.1 hypothetical protein AK89_07490 [Enterococcus mundtii CRL35]MDK4211329.1 hypothetical protein [Enterococcus mundtii]
MKESNEYIKLIEKLREEKDMDKIAETFSSIISAYGLSVMETCSLAYYLVDRALNTPQNKLMLQEKFFIDTDKLGVDGKLTIMKAMLSVYSKEVYENDKT